MYLNLWAIHHDPNYWDKPEQFNVERFLSPEGKLIKHDAFMPFSVGRRSCPGEPLAQVELFMYLTMTLQRFKVEAPKGVKISLEPVMAGISMVPNRVALVFKNRK